MAEIKNMAGLKFGLLTVKEFSHIDKKGCAHWTCECECGNTKIANGAYLRDGHVSSCGCLVGIKSRKDLTGQRFGRLLVVGIFKRGGRIGEKKKRLVWKCLCDCGNEHHVTTNDLKSGRINSCGCLKREMHSLSSGEAALNQKYSQYATSAKRRNLEFSLSKEEFVKITSMNCIYCNTPPRQKGKSRHNTGDFLYNGIDRVDNDLGYVAGNVVPCCDICNKSKRNMTLSDFLNWIKNISLVSGEISEEIFMKNTKHIFDEINEF